MATINQRYRQRIGDATFACDDYSATISKQGFPSHYIDIHLHAAASTIKISREVVQNAEGRSNRKDEFLELSLDANDNLVVSVDGQRLTLDEVAQRILSPILESSLPK